MAPIGTLYSYPGNFRVQRALVVAALNGLEVNVPADFNMAVDTKTPEFLAKFPLGKVPAFEAADGFCLSEGSAIAAYLAAAGPLASQLLGSDLNTKAKITEWTLFTNSEIIGHFGPPMLMGLYKFLPYNEGQFNASAAAFERALGKIEHTVKGGKKYLVGEQLTLADLEVAAALSFASSFLLDAEMRAKVPGTVEYLKGILALPEVAKVFGEYKPCETRLKGNA
ncbi:hypothetical protein VMCG_07244 [Cytospora schulzeri]|uniref:Glutathione S-transferase n=1 Tax=Cytospora schulzeri TaxID=448051 RepID=A0A423WAI2_9PEZI|nr:hypothetical protein VMCG_07244 [Valsa malicola]